MENSHFFSIANYREVIPEKEARQIFREFKPELFESSFDLLFADDNALATCLKRQQEAGEFSYGISRRFASSTPDMFLLTGLFWGVDGSTMVIAYPDLHRSLIGNKNESVEDMLRHSLGFNITAGGIHPKLHDLMTMAFTPREERAQFIDPTPSNQRRISLHLAENVPDLSDLGDTESRYDSVVDLLTYDIHHALWEVASHMGITIDQMQRLKVEDRELYAEIHRQPGMLYAIRNVNGILSDLKNGGENNLFKIRPDLGDDPQTTELGRCPGESYARNFLQGLGNSLKKNRDTVLEVIK